MYIIGTFQHGIYLELALKDILNKGIERKHILCVPLNKRVETKKFFDTIHRSDGRNTMGLPFFLATAFALFGAIYGFLWKWGPIIWGGLGFLAGLAVGFLIDFILFKIYNKSKRKDNLTEVIVMIHCDETKEKEITDIFWEQGAFGVAKLIR
jgi:pilus assembly protein TadC